MSLLEGKVPKENFSYYLFVITFPTEPPLIPDNKYIDFRFEILPMKRNGVEKTGYDTGYDISY